jgi:hypothetical protein
MSRISDELAKVDGKRRHSGSDGPGDDRGPGGEIQLEKGPGVADRHIIDSRFGLGAAANRERFAVRESLYSFYGVGLIAAMVAGMILDRYLVDGGLPMRPRQDQVKTATASTPVAAVLSDAAPVKARLPSCIPLDAPDSGYASSHPGWQRYLAEASEFRVFRELGSVRAIQVIARDRDPLPKSLIDKFLNQLAGNMAYSATSQEIKAGYQIEKGRLGRLAEVITYRKMPTDEIRALVVVYLAS